MFSKISIMCPEEEDIAKESKNVFIIKNNMKLLVIKVMKNIEFLFNCKKKYFDIGEKYFDIGNKYIRHSDFPQCYDHRSADWLFVLNTLHFSLYIPRVANQWKVNGKTGYSALCCAMKRAIKDRKKPIWNPRYYVNMNAHEMKELFIGDDGTSIPLMQERLEILHNIGRILIQKYDGTFLTCIKLCNNNARLLMSLLTNEFKCYQDQGIYNGKKVSLNTKAKILINDLRFYFPINTTTCVTTSTIFASYHSLELFIKLCVLRCSETLQNKFETSNDPIHYGNSTEELELRSCAIVAVKMICEEVQKRLSILTKDEIDFIKPFSIPILVDNTLFTFCANHQLFNQSKL